MAASTQDVHVVLADLSSDGQSIGNGIPFDSSSELVAKESWPSFDSWEFTVIFEENLQGEKLQLFQTFLGLVEKTGLIGQLFKSPSNENQLILKLRATQSWYDERATKLSYVYELKPIVCRSPEGETAKITKMYEPFDADEKENFMFEGYHNMYTSFRGSMIEYYLRERSDDDVPGCDLSYYFRNNKTKIVKNYFPNHEEDRVTWFDKNWILSMPWNDAPIDEIRNYFGEKIAFYFAWLAHFTNWLVAPGIVGVILAFFLLSRKIEEINRSVVGPVFGVFLMIYMTCYLEFWKRAAATLAFRWGVIDFDKREPDRPEYETKEEQFNMFTQQKVKVYPKGERLRKQIIGIPAVLFTIAAACTIIVIILMWKLVNGFLGPDQQDDPYGPWKLVVPSLVNTIAILIFSKAHRFLATYLNDWENYQTQSEYESQLIRKVFFFEFVNNFTGLLYTAFSLGDMYQLYFAILIQMLIMQFVGNFLAVLLPLVEKFKNQREVSKSNKKLAWSDVLAGNDAYDTFGDFNEIVIQFGYVMFFSAAFPAAAILSWVNNVIEIRLDAFSILHCEPRPAAERKGGIGIWFDIIELMSFIAIVINALIFALTSNAIGSGIHNACQLEFKNVDVTVNPYTLRSLNWVQQGCINFCSGMYQSQTFHNPKIPLGPCDTFYLINPSTKQPYPSCRTTPSPIQVECTAQNPCPGKDGPPSLAGPDNNCDSPFVCNPVPLDVPKLSERAMLGRGNRDYSRAYCQESPPVNMGTGEWHFEKPTQVHAWNPFVLGESAYVPRSMYEYGMISCTLVCKDKAACPYAKENPKFNPLLKRKDPFKPEDYIAPGTLKAIQDSQTVACVKSGSGYAPPANQEYCFLCPSVDLSLTPLFAGSDDFNEIVFTTKHGPTVAVLWTILIFEHVVFIIKFFVMAVSDAAPQIPDVTDDIEEQLTGHDTFRHRLAMQRSVRRPHRPSEQPKSNLVEASASPQKLHEDDDIWVRTPRGRVIELNVFCGLEYLLFAEAEAHFTAVLQVPRDFTLKMFTDSFSQPQEHAYSKPGPNHLNQRAGDDPNAKLASA